MDELDDLAHVRAERDLYRGLLDLAELHDPRAFLTSACELLGRCTSAEGVYIAVYEGDAVVWWASHGMDTAREDRIAQQLSRGVLAQAMATGEVVRTSSALLDDRFANRESVRRNRIEAVLCAPVALAPPRIGLVYLHRSAGGGPFDDGTVEVVRRITERLGTVGAFSLPPTADPTARARAHLARCDVVGRSAALGALLDQIATIAPVELDVLLTGPTGTGKSHLARMIHENSPRSGGPLVVVNCAALPESLFEAEMFGAAPGAYTGSTGSREGLVGAAERGTLFLDEVAELTLPAQAKLLRLLQDRVYHRVGETRERRANVRVVSATNVDLDQAVRERRFREDLRFRLEVLPLAVPSLTERRGDIPALAEHFLAEAIARNPTLGVRRLSVAAHHALWTAPWPGNVRQLQHAVHAGHVRAAARQHGAIEVSDLFPEAPSGTATWQEATREFQRQLLAEALSQTGGSVADAARRLDLARSHAFELVKAFGLKAQGG